MAHDRAPGLLSRCLLRARRFVRALALADHTPYGGY